MACGGDATAAMEPMPRFDFAWVLVLGLASPRARARACRVRVPGRRGGRVAGIREWGERRETRERGKCGKLISLFGSVSDTRLTSDD